MPKRNRCDGQMQKIVVVKLGGSAITDKSGICSPRLDAIHRAAGQIAAYQKPLILLHGGGSFAHPFVSRKLMASGFKGRAQLQRVSEVELNLDQLTRIIGVSLLLRGRPFVPLRPMSLMTLSDGNVKSYFLRPLTSALGLGLIPLLHGDLAMDERKGIGVVSGDRIASLLGTKLPVSRVLFGCDVDGVYSSYRKRRVILQVDKWNFASVLKGLKVSNSDVTGGMLGKVHEALDLARKGVESYIFNLNDGTSLARLLRGESAEGTHFVPWG